MTEYLVETYVAGGRAAGAVVARATAHAQAAATNGGAAVRYVRAIFVPGDEICFHLFEAPSRAAVAAVVARAGLADCRIVEAVSTFIAQTEREP